MGAVLTAGNVALDTVARSAAVAGVPVSLSRHEMAILEQLMRRQSRLVPKDILFDNVYGADALPESNTVPVHIHHLRKQLAALKATVEIDADRFTILGESEETVVRLPVLTDIDTDRQCTNCRVPRPLAVAIALIRSNVGSLPVGGAGEALDVEVHHSVGNKHQSFL
jgi:hypothetical protein